MTSARTAARRWTRGVKPVIARRGADHGSGLGAQRGLLGGPSPGLHNLRRLRTRSERRADLHQAFMVVGCAVVGRRMLR